MGIHHDLPQIVGIGEVLWDLLPNTRVIGGTVANFAFHTNAMGVPATLVSCVGEDALGREILDRMATWNMDARYLCTRSVYPTGWVDVQVWAIALWESEKNLRRARRLTQRQSPMFVRILQRHGQLHKYACSQNR